MANVERPDRGAGEPGEGDAPASLRGGDKAEALTRAAVEPGSRVRASVSEPAGGDKAEALK